MSALPLLLEAGTPDLETQVRRARCRHKDPEFWDFNRFFVCVIDSTGIRERLPWWVKECKVWGCIAIDTAPEQACGTHAHEAYQSYVLFQPAWFREAWGVARSVARSHPNRPAILDAEGLGWSVFVIVGSKHKAVMRGSEV